MTHLKQNLVFAALALALCACGLTTFAGNDFYTIENYGAGVKLYVLDNDVNAYGTKANWVVGWSQPSSGVVSGASSGAWTPYLIYTPALGFVGTVVFDYTAYHYAMPGASWLQNNTVTITVVAPPSSGGEGGGAGGGGRPPKPVL